MLQRLGPRDKNDDRTDEQLRKEFDNSIGVRAWRMPGQVLKPEIEEALSEPGAPSWWMGEEDASQSFLKSMGVVFDGN